MIGLPVEVALRAIIAVCELLVTDEGQAWMRDAREQREDLVRWLRATWSEAAAKPDPFATVRGWFAQKRPS